MIPYLPEFLILIGVSVIAAIVLGRLRLPAVAGLVLAGTVVGPHALGLIGDAKRIDTLAQYGVAILLFTIGLEFSLSRLKRVGQLVALGGSLQVGLTVAVVTPLALLAGKPWSVAVFLGCLTALTSSTAIVLRLLADRGEVDTPHGRCLVGTLLFQDLAVVPMLLIMPILAGQARGGVAGELSTALGKALTMIAGTLLLSRLLVPRFFALVDRLRSREVFLFSVLLIIAGTTYLATRAGLSPILGAFLAGVILADSDYAHRAMAEVLPLRDVLTSLFFLSLGMLFDPAAILMHPFTVAAIFCVLTVVKGAAAGLAALPLRLPPRVAVLVGVGHTQFGEFGFVLALAGRALGLLSAEETSLLFAAGVLTLFVTPVAFRLAPRLAAEAAKMRRLERLVGGGETGGGKGHPGPASGQVVIVGYGVAGQVLARALRESELPYLVLELNARTVRTARAAGEPIVYGDIGSEHAITRIALSEARALVLLINDAKAAERAVAAARRLAPETPIFVRTRYLSVAGDLSALGATEVIVEEVEAGLEMLARVLRAVGTPRNVLSERVDQARQRTLLSARAESPPRRRLGEMSELEQLAVESFLVRQDAHAAGRSPAGLQLRTRTGATVVAVAREGKLLEQPDPQEEFRAGDVLYLVGSAEPMAKAMRLLEEGT